MEGVMRNRSFVILCGGSGERLWPLSRHNRPKQLIPFIDGKTLLEQTIERIQPLVSSSDVLGLVTTEEYQELIEKTVGSTVGKIWAEPVARNTAPAILLAAYDIAQRNPDQVIAFLPADHFIPDAAAFNDALLHALELVSLHDVIATLGVKPTRPATGYGYIQAAPTINRWSPVSAFHEKPTAEQAAAYCASGSLYWNIGIYVGKASAFCAEAEVHAPDLFAGIKAYVAGRGSYDQLHSISFDYAIAEKSDRLVLYPCDFAWNDIGNLAVFLELTAAYTNNASPVINCLGEGNVAYAGKKTVAVIGVSDLCIIETDDVTLVVKKSDAEKVKTMVHQLKQEKRETIL